MNIEQLHYLKMIVEKKTYLQAAMELHISQSSLSKQIMKLENELNVKLFDRSKRHVSLTKEGEIVYRDSIKMLEAYDLMCQHLQDEIHHLKNQIKIGILPIYAHFGLGDLLRQFEQEHPDIHLQIDELEERDLDYYVLNSPCDIYFLRGEFEVLQKYKAYKIYADALVAVVSKNHPLAKKKRISIRELKDENLLMFPDYTTIRKVSEKACTDAGFTPHIVKHGRENTLIYFAKENEGVALMMKESLSKQNARGLKILPIQENIQSWITMYVASSMLEKHSVQEMIHFFENVKKDIS